VIKKILLLTAAVMVSASSLFAYTSGNIVVSPEVGIGLAFPQISKNYKTVVEEDDGMGGTDTYVYDPKFKVDGMGLNWSVGVNCNYFLMDTLSLLGGLSLDSSYVDVKAKGEKAQGTTMYRIIVPVGAHYHYNLSPVQIVLGGGLYLGVPLSYKTEMDVDVEDEYGDPIGTKKKTISLDRTVDLGLFIDAGVSFETTKTSNVLGFLRFKTDLIGSDVKYKSEKMWGGMRDMSLSLNVSYGFQIN